MFKLILQQGVLDDSDTALSYALQHIHPIKRQYYVAELINAGAEINANHLAQLAQLKQDHPQQWQALVERVPQLSSSN